MIVAVDDGEGSRTKGEGTADSVFDALTTISSSARRSPHQALRSGFAVHDQLADERNP